MDLEDCCNGACMIDCGIFWCFPAGHCCYAGCDQRSATRRRIGIAGDDCSDCCIHMWCTSCALTQEHRELKEWRATLSVAPPNQQMGVTVVVQQPMLAQPMGYGQVYQGQPMQGQPVQGQYVQGQGQMGYPVQGQPMGYQPVQGQVMQGQPIQGQPYSNQFQQQQPIMGSPPSYGTQEGETAEGQPS